MELILNTIEFTNLQKRLGLSFTKLASKIGVSRSHLWRLIKNQCNPGEQFIAGFKAAFPDEDFDKFFLLKALQQSDTTNTA